MLGDEAALPTLAPGATVTTPLLFSSLPFSPTVATETSSGLVLTLVTAHQIPSGGTTRIAGVDVELAA